MRKFVVDWLPGEDVVYGRVLAEFNIRADLADASARLGQILDTAGRPVAYIIDLTEFNMSFGEMVMAMAELTRGDLGVWKHHNLKEIIVVGDKPMFKLGANALRQTQYGKLRAAVFTCMDDALRYLRAKRSLISQIRSNN